METLIPQNNHGDPFYSTAQYHNCLVEASEYILNRLGVDKIDISIVEGSGLLDISNHLIPDPIVINMSEVPHCPIPTAIGHKQGILYGILNGKRTIIWNGRIHYYEGYRVAHQAFPAYLSAYLGCAVFITTNAAGFINQSMQIGDLALITDHINMINKTYDGAFYLDKSFRYNKDITTDIFHSSAIYDKELVDLTRESFIEAGLKLTEGHYCYFALPNFESPSEIQIMHDLGAATVGASTLPEQIACYLTGMRRVIVSSATSPSSGMSNQEISGEEVLECGRKCVLSFAKLLPVLIGKLKDEMFLNKRPNILLNQFSVKENLDNFRTLRVDTNEIGEQIQKAVVKTLGDRKIARVFWLMTDQLFQQFLEENAREAENPIYFINLNDIYSFRTRSYKESQFVLLNVKGEQWLLIRQPYLEGMLPFEYSSILKALKYLEVTKVNVFFEASSVHDSTLNQQTHLVANNAYLNKRFYKLTEEGVYDQLQDLPSISLTQQNKDQKSLIIFEGTMLPSKTELAFAKKGKFDLYTITNFSFADTAQHIGLNIDLQAVTKEDLVQGHEIKVEGFAKSTIEQSQVQQEEQKQVEIQRLEVKQLDVDATFEVEHSRDFIYQTADKVKEVLGVVDNVLILEKESFEVFITQITDAYTIEKKIRFVLKDYQDNKTVDAIKIKTNEGKSIIVLSQMLTYQTNVPFQTALLPMRIIILGCEAKNFISCPHIWTLQWERSPESYSVGDLFLVKDHANMSAQPPGVGPNIDEYGPRFYDISTMYEKNFVQTITGILESHSLKYAYGEIFWVNNTTIPSFVFNNLAQGVSNHRVCFKGLTKSGINELMAVHHRRNYSPYKLTTSILGLVTDSVIRRQSQSEAYIQGVKNLVQVAFESFSKLAQ